MAEKHLLTVREVSEILGLSRTTIWRLAASQKIPAPLKIGGATRWRKADIDALIADGAA